MSRKSAFLAATLAVAAAGQGCSRQDETREYRTVEGVIEMIDLPKGEVTLRFYSQKRDRELTITGTATAETEVSINGVLSSLQDLREGERVTVVGWVEGRGADRQVVAERVVAERAETIRRKPAPTSAPATGQPGNAET
jgi:hypothetical protein